LLLGLSITALWTLRMLGVAVFVFFLFAVLPVLVLRRRPHRTWFQRSLLSLNVALVAVALIAASVLTWFDDQFGDIPRQEFAGDVLAEQAEPGEPQNFLLVGIDQSAGLDSDDPVNIGRNSDSVLSDTVMVLRVIPDEHEAHLISFPRDLWLPIAGTGRSGRINEALQAGGPQALIQTLGENYGIPIHHYVQVNFVGFQELVQIIGGVPMFFPSSVRDPTSGLEVLVDEGGECVTLGPEMALAFVRSRRNYQTLVDGVWELDPSADLGRIRRQQLFMQLAMAQAVDKGARNPTTLGQFIEVGQEHVVLDEDLPIGELLDLGTQFSDFDPRSLRTYQLPVSLGNVGEASVVFLEEDEAQEELNVFRGLGLFITPASVRVNVRNGSGVANQGIEVVEGLQSTQPQGFTIASSLNADTFDYARTTIRYTEGNLRAAAFLARYLEEDPVLELVPDLGDATVELITGTDFAGIRTEARPESEVEDLLEDEPTTTTTTEPDSTTTAPTTTTTIGMIPEQPPDKQC
jgi:LCP family protein required for cell wall assembly